MARRNDHTRKELKELAISAGQNIISAEGLSKFSARKVAKEVGYTVGTLYNVFEDYNDIVLHINAATLDAMYEYVSENIKDGNKYNQDAQGAQHIYCTQDSQDADCSSSLYVKAIKDMASFYIRFAHENYNRWNALFIFNLPQGVELPDWYIDKMTILFVLIEKPLLSLFNGDNKATERSAKVIWASVHGICQLGLTGKLDAVGAERVQVLANDMIEHYIKGLKS